MLENLSSKDAELLKNLNEERAMALVHIRSIAEDSNERVTMILEEDILYKQSGCVYKYI
ncbi:hypothetical protein HCA64_06395 [Listeria booriae]|nr:hypothetical protein [Listeria booriae]